MRLYNPLLPLIFYSTLGASGCAVTAIPRDAGSSRDVQLEPRSVSTLAAHVPARDGAVPTRRL